MSQKKIQQAFVLSKLVADPNFTIAEAAQAMDLSERQTKRLKKEFKERGVDALVHKNIGKAPANAISEDVREYLVKLKRTSPYDKANFSFFNELIQRPEHGIHISYGTLHAIMTCAGLQSTKKRRATKKHRSRKRKAREGLMLQIDASPFDWLNTEQEFALHGAIDDATGKITSLYLCKNECLQGYFEVMRNTIAKHGIPLGLYSDRHTIFVSPNHSKLSIEDELKGIRANDTQFGRALRQLGIASVIAKSPQAKGRIERLWGTLQGRLPIEFALAGIKTIDVANVFLQKFIDDYNDQFSVSPESSVSSYRPLSVALNLENILCVVEKRTFDNGGVFSFYNRSYILASKNGDGFLPTKGSIDVLVSPVFGIRAAHHGVIYQVLPFIKPPKANKPLSRRNKGKYIPPDTHYFKYGHSLMPKVTFEDDDRVILKMLERVFLRNMTDVV